MLREHAVYEVLLGEEDAPPSAPASVNSTEADTLERLPFIPRMSQDDASPARVINRLFGPYPALRSPPDLFGKFVQILNSKKPVMRRYVGAPGIAVEHYCS
jgi:hypothetical protein